MMCFLLSGSLSQSLLKQIMSCPSIMPGCFPFSFCRAQLPPHCHSRAHRLPARNMECRQQRNGRQGQAPVEMEQAIGHAVFAAADAVENLGAAAACARELQSDAGSMPDAVQI